jgi:hypothetical protein
VSDRSSTGQEPGRLPDGWEYAAADQIRATVGTPDSVRQRAQQSAALSLAVAAAVVTAGAIGAFGDRPVWLQVLGACAVVTWLAAAGVFLWTVAGARPTPLRQSTVETAFAQSHESLVRLLLEFTADERQRVVRPLRVALGCAAVALTLTGAAVTCALFVGPTDPRRVKATVVLTRSAHSAVSGACGRTVSQRLEAWLATEDLAKTSVALDLDPPECSQHRVTVDIPRSSVVAVVVDSAE